VFFFKSEAIYK